jgi:hypothetical protein
MACSGTALDFYYINYSVLSFPLQNLTKSARNGNLEAPVDILKAKQGYTMRKVENYIWI